MSELSIVWSMRTAAPIRLSPAERSALTTWAQGRRVPFRLVQRARIVQLAANGVSNQGIARQLDLSRPTVIVDNYGTHKHSQVKAWLRRHPRVHLHFIPTSSSWLNLVERWFRELTDKRLRRGSFHNVPELIAAITQYLDHHNQSPRVFVWTAPVERILTKVTKCKEALDALH